MVTLNFDRARPDVLLNLNEVPELRSWSRENGTVRLGSGLTYTEALNGALADELPALAEASRTVGSPQIRNRGTIGGNLGTASPAGDALPPLLIEGAEIELASVRGTRRVPLTEFLVGPKQNALGEDELIVAAVLAAQRSAPDVHEGRPTKRDGHRRVLPGARRRSRARGVARLFRVRGTRLGTRRRCRSASQKASRTGSPSRRARSTTFAALRHIAAMRCGSSPAARFSGASRDLALQQTVARSRIEALRRLSVRLQQTVARLAGGSIVRISITVNGERLETDVWAGESLLTTLRDRLRLPGSKNACEQGECGSCSVLLDGELVCSCLVLAAQADGHEVVTVEGLVEDERLHPVQTAFAETGAVQCGFCTPGFVVAAADLLRRVPDPSDDEIREALSGNLCRCTGYQKILDAVHLAAAR